jgi:hypothetical protein
MKLFWVIFAGQAGVKCPDSGAIEANSREHALALVSLMFGHKVLEISRLSDAYSGWPQLLAHREPKQTEEQ